MTRVNVEVKDSLATEEYDDEQERNARFEAVRATGRQAYRVLTHKHDGSVVFSVSWYEPRKGDPAVDLVTPLADNPMERKRRA